MQTTRDRLSIIVPFHRGLSNLERCLAALSTIKADPAAGEVIVAADRAVEDCRVVASTYGARLVTVQGPPGPAAARNRAASLATGDVLVFVDADVVVSPSSLSRLARILRDRPGTAAVFGAYDQHPADTGFLSEYKNLSHAFVHRSSAPGARTFWAGFGAVRRDAFEKVGGFDERFNRPSVEDIDLGYRLTMAGYEVVLDPTLSACHLKRWTLRSTIATDIRDRGIPWTQLIARYGVPADHLNLRAEYRWSVVLAHLAVVLLTLAAFDWRFLVGAVAALLEMTILNRRSLAYFYARRGAVFAVGVWVLQLAQHLYNGFSFAVGRVLFYAARYAHLRLPGALPAEPWNVERAHSTQKPTIALNRAVREMVGCECISSRPSSGSPGRRDR